MSEEEVERFEITDYDLENEFNINRPRRKLTKNQQIYGIWADEEHSSSSRPSFKSSGSSKNYTGPVSFVSGGVEQAGKKKTEQTTDRESGDEEDDGYVKSSLNLSSSEEDSDNEKPSFKSHSGQFDVQDDIAGLRKSKGFLRSNRLIQEGVGSWEKHTKGIGAKLLLQMGYQPGKGLGKDLQGISAPVEAHLRKGRGAIGAYGPEKLQASISEKKKSQKIEDIKKETEDSSLSHWRKGGPVSRKKVTYAYKSVDEVIEKGPRLRTHCSGDYSQISRVKVIDMTGPEQRVLSGYHAIAGQMRPSEEWEMRKDEMEKKLTHFALPELQHNLNILVDLCEQDIIVNNKKLQHAKDRIVALEQEEDQLKKVVEEEGKQLDKLSCVLDIIESISKRKENPNEQPLKMLDFCAHSFKQLQEEYYEEYCMYQLSPLAVGLIVPILKEVLSKWKPLESPGENIPLFQRWKDILEVDISTLTNCVSPYHQLIWEAWMPSIRIAISAWNCRECEPLIELLEHWLPLVPPWVMDNIRDQLVMPRIEKEVEEWNPVADMVPIHAWVHPWIPLLGKRLESSVFPTIRQKLGRALVNWHPSDPSARLMLLPWKNVFSQGDLDAFVVKNILPKLQIALQELIINPHQQHLEQWNWVMDWKDLIPVVSMASLLERQFFPKWLHVLTLWLNHNPNYTEITNWYMGWKGMIPETLVSQPAIKEQFRKALDMMNRAVTMPGQALGAVESVSYLTNLEQSAIQSPRFEVLAEAVRSASQIPEGFKDLLQKRCEERGIVFVPLANRYWEGKQVYRCGKMQVYLDKNVIFLSENGMTWAPTSLMNVLNKAAD